MSDITVLSVPFEPSVINSYAGGVIYAGVSTYTEIAAGSAISGHRAIAVVGGSGVYADAGTIGHAFLVQGISAGAASLGEPIRVANRQRMIEPSWSWTPGSPIYLGVNGVLTQSVPSLPSAVFLLQLAVAISATEIDIDIQLPIFL